MRLDPAGARRRALNEIYQAVLTGVGKATNATPRSKRALAAVDFRPGLAYGPEPHRKLDLFLPRDAVEPPAILYLHGGGFTALSRETHRGFALQLVRCGHAVALPDYRLAPAHPYPAACEDAARAWRWLVTERASLGLGDRLVVAGESAGANLTVVVALAATFEREEPWARQVFDLGRVPDALMPACGIYDFHEPERRVAEDGLSRLGVARLGYVVDSYLGARAPEETPLASPVVVLESDAPPARPWPATFIAVGGDDPLARDSRRLAAALERRGADVTLHVYPGMGHAFQAATSRGTAKQFWKHTELFLRRIAQPGGGRRRAASGRRRND